jgi:hypothetical protein
MSDPLVALQNLEELYRRGFRDPVTDAALLKVASSQAARDELVLHDLERDLHELEQQHGMSSDEFARRWQAGQLPDTADLMDWNALCRMASQIRARLELLRSGLQSL